MRRLLACAAAVLVTAVAPSQAMATDGMRQFIATLSVQQALEIASENPAGDTQVRLLLRGGGSLQGAVRAAPPANASVVLAHADGSTSVVRVDEVASVTVIDPGSARAAFQGNRIVMEPTDEPPTPLAFRRRLAELESGKPVSIGAVFSEGHVRSATCRFYADRILTALSTAVTHATRDAMGREAFSAAGSSVQVRAVSGAPLELVRHETSVELVFDCEAPLPSDYANTIRARLESLI